MATKAAKQILRKEIKRRVAQLTETERIRQSQVVTDKLLKTPQYQQSQRVCVYLSMQDEIRTEAILHDLFAQNKVCYIPRYVGPKMDMVRLHSMEDYDSLPETAWKIKQPSDNEEREDAISAGGLDLLLMPGLGFTMEGHRIGRGKGYYDTYLAKYETQLHRRPITLALAFSQQICDTIPMSDHDIPVDFVLYEDMQKGSS